MLPSFPHLGGGARMRRREFIAFGGGAAAWPIVVRAQQPAKLWRVAYLSPAASFNPVDEMFEKSLEQFGWIQDRNIKVDYRFTEGRHDKVATVVADVASMDPD